MGKKDLFFLQKTFDDIVVSPESTTARRFLELQERS